MIRRREFIQRAAVAAAVFGFPLAQAEKMFSQGAPPLPSQNLLASDPDRYWAELRRQWLLAADHVNLNCGSVGCTPLPILRATIDHLLSAEEFREPAYPWFGYEENTRLRELRDALAAYLNCKRDELALVRNATEANNVMANGLDLKPGDEILMTDQEHPGGRGPWEQRAARYGVKLNTVALPKPPESDEQIVDIFARGITPRTKVIFFSHIPTVSGVVLPAKKICALARERGIFSQVDGAHTIGQIPLDMHDMGCDFYGTSPHKWLMAPKGTGTLYVREELLEKVWANTVSGSWKDYSLKAYRFSVFGTSNLSVFVGLKAALDFHQTLGPDRVYARMHEMARKVHDHVAKYPQLYFWNASRDEYYGGLTCFGIKPNADGAANKGLERAAAECAARNIRIAGGADHFRIATHIFTQPTELDLFFDALDTGLRA